MRGISRSDGRRLARVCMLAAGALALTGCAAGYSLVQPGAPGAGEYYTGHGPYAASGYAYDGGVAAYDPYAADYGYGSLYGPSFTFGLGLGGACGWSCAGFYSGWPWYYGGLGYYGTRRHHGHHHHGDPVTADPAPRAWPHPDHPRVPPPEIAPGAAQAIPVPQRPREGLASRRVFESQSFAPPAIERAPQPAGFPDRPAHAAPRPTTFTERPIREMAAPHEFARPAAPVVLPQVAPPPARGNQAPAAKIR